MRSHFSFANVVLTTVICLASLSGCDSGNGNSMVAGTKPKDSSHEEPPGPQTEPPLLQPDDPVRSIEATPAAESSVATETEIDLQVVDRAGFDDVLAKHKGKVVLVDYWATWCAPCRKKFPHTVALAKQHQADGLTLITVSMDDEDDHAKVLQFLTDQQANFSNLRSQGGTEDFEAFEIPESTLPCLRLFDRAGQVVKTFAIDPNADKQFTEEDVAEAVKAELAKPAN